MGSGTGVGACGAGAGNVENAGTQEELQGLDISPFVAYGGCKIGVDIQGL